MDKPNRCTPYAEKMTGRLVALVKVGHKAGVWRIYVHSRGVFDQFPPRDCAGRSRRHRPQSTRDRSLTVFRRLTLVFALGALTLGAALAATPAVNQETWTVGLTVPILTVFLLPLSLLGSLLRPGRRHSRGGRS